MEEGTQSPPVVLGMHATCSSLVPRGAEPTRVHTRYTLALQARIVHEHLVLALSLFLPPAVPSASRRLVLRWSGRGGSGWWKRRPIGLTPPYVRLGSDTSLALRGAVTCQGVELVTLGRDWRWPHHQMPNLQSAKERW